MTTSANGRPAGLNPRTGTTHMKRVVAATLAAAVAIVAAIVTSAPAQASPAPVAVGSHPAMATAATQDIKSLINERTCNSAQLPRQIWLTSDSRPTRCFGGTVGSLNLNNFPVEWLSPGDYHGTIYCVGLTLRFRPAQDSLLDRTCSRLEIRPAS